MSQFQFNQKLSIGEVHQVYQTLTLKADLIQMYENLEGG